MDLRNLFSGSMAYSSSYRGVTKHKVTGRYEVNLWDRPNDNGSRKGKQVYLGGFKEEETAARAYDLIALKYWGLEAVTNFPIITYEKELKEMHNMSRQEYIHFIRRSSATFSRGASVYRGVTRNESKWQARIANVAGKVILHLGTFETEEEAAKAYDIAAIKYRGIRAITNFEKDRYDVKAIMSEEQPVRGKEERTSTVQDTESSNDKILKDAANARAESNVKKSIVITGSTESSLIATINHSNIFLGPSNASLEQPIQASPAMACNRKLNPAAQSLMPANKSNGFLYNLIGLKPGAICEHGISKSMAPLPSHSFGTGHFIYTQEELAAQYIDTQEELVSSKAPAYENRMCVGAFTSTLVCSPGQPSGTVRTDYDNVIMAETNWITSCLQYPESGPSGTPSGTRACQTSQNEPTAETARQAPVMFNIWSDLRM